MRIVIAIALIAALGACETTTGSNTPVSAPSKSVSSNNIGPGATLLSLKTTALLFQEVCVKTVRNNAKFRQALASNGFSASPATGTFYDNKRNVSFKWVTNGGKPVCSMVFVSNEEPGQLGIMLAVGSQAPKSGKAEIDIDPKTFATRTKSRGNSTMTFTPSARTKGGRYYRATIAAS